MAEHDLTARMAAHMNCHLVFPLLEFLQWRPGRVYAVEEILQAKLRLLIQGTNMVDYAMDTHKLLHGDTDDDVVVPVPDDMVERRHEVVTRLGALAAPAAPIVSALKNHHLGPDKEHNIRMLHERFQIPILFLYLNAIQTDAPHLLRYLAAAIVVNRRRRNMLKELVKVIQQEQHIYKDPITEFLECLYVNHDFDGAQQKLIECEQVILNDPFLGKRIEEGNSMTMFFQCFAMNSMLSEKLKMSYNEAELWIMNLVSNSKLDAKIDTASGTLIMTANHANIHQQFIESLKNLDMRTFMLAKSTMEPA
uniref:Eukaryotic translation initiation factor 3 subunit E N-terminal domain-containing protein n=1 Tax=Oryza nivara TaxID=4536 RepID=A0A0E0I192_ORYNI